MRLTLHLTVVVFVIRSCLTFPSPQNISDVFCPDYGDVEFATVKLINNGNFQVYAVHVECNPGYELVGRHKLLCRDGKWEQAPRPQCVPLTQCLPLPGIRNGVLSLDGDKAKGGFYKKGTLASYTCDLGYKLTPPESQYRVCEKGIWTGPIAKCILYDQLGCSRPRDIANGYYVLENNGVLDRFGVGQRLHYSCDIGYRLIGSQVQQCLDDGSWSPGVAPRCNPEVTGEFNFQLFHIIGY